MADYSPRSKDEAEAQATSATPSSQTNDAVSRSCYSCNRKKVRCDKRQPCSACVRAGRDCAYPVAGPRVRRTKKTIMEGMATRISSLEKSVATTADKRTPFNKGAINASHTPPITPSLHVEDLNQVSLEDTLVRKGLSAQHYNEALLSKVLAKEHNTEPGAATSRALPSRSPAWSPFNAAGILSAPISSTAPAACHPTRLLAVRLWKLYLENVDSYTAMKVLHRPTDEVKVYSTIDNPAAASMDSLALNFVIYFHAIVSITDSTVEEMLGQDKRTLLLQFKVGLEQALAYGGFLDQPTLTGLQALVMYLTALRIHNRGKGIWILNGFAIRIAQSLGLHHDGSRLGLTPFESEVRRRLWWQLLCRDSRAGEDYGLENSNSLLLDSEVRLPLNVDDAELYPEILRLPVAKKSWTPTTLLLINIHLAKATQRLALLTAASSPSSPPSETARLQIVEEVRTSVEQWLAYCNPVVPHHRQVIYCSRFQLRKLDYATRLQWGVLQFSGPITNLITEANLVEALELLEWRGTRQDDLLQQFAWAQKGYPQYHVLMYVMWHLSIHPDGPSVDRAWRAVEEVFSQELEDESTIGLGSKWALLEALKAKAVAAREASQTPRVIEHVAGSEENADVRLGNSSFDLSGPSVGFDGNMGVADLSAEGADEEWPNWATLVQGFQLNDLDGFW